MKTFPLPIFPALLFGPVGFPRQIAIVLIGGLLGCATTPISSAHASFCINTGPVSCAESSVTGLDTNLNPITSLVSRPDTILPGGGTATAASAGGSGALLGSAFASAAPGLLRATASSQSSANLSDHGGITTRAEAEFIDVGTVNSTTFTGTATIQLTYHIDGTSTGAGGIGPAGAFLSVGNQFFDISGIYDLNVTVGAPIGFKAFLSVFADSGSAGSISSSADFGNSLHVFFDVPEGYTFDTLSGHNYSSTLLSAVPEPSTWAMVVLGFAGVGFMAYRRRNTAPHVA